MSASGERSRLQPWVKSIHEPQDGWVVWKIEDRFRPGLPDFLIHAPTNRTTLLEIKWATTKTKVQFHLTPNQWSHLKQWGEGAFVLVAVPALGGCWMVPIESLHEPHTTLSPEEADRLPGVERCGCSRASVRAMLTSYLD